MKIIIGTKWIIIDSIAIMKMREYTKFSDWLQFVYDEYLLQISDKYCKLFIQELSEYLHSTSST